MIEKTVGFVMNILSGNNLHEKIQNKTRSERKT
jgi:hypothetical protein